MVKRRLTRGAWTSKDLSLLKRMFPDHPTAEVATRLGRPRDAVKKKASRLGLRKSRRYLRSLGRLV